MTIAVQDIENRSPPTRPPCAADLPGRVETQGKGEQDGKVSGHPVLVPPLPQPAGG